MIQTILLFTLRPGVTDEQVAVLDWLVAHA